MVDMISKGRLVSGFVRGGGSEQFANNTNPAYNRERFEEAHDLLIKIRTAKPGHTCLDLRRPEPTVGSARSSKQRP